MRRSNHPAPHLVELDAFEQRLEIAFPEAFIALALNDLEEDRADDVLGEDLQQQALALGRRTVHQNVAPFELGDRLLVALDTFRKHFVIGIGRVLEGNAAVAQDVDGPIDIRCAERDMLNSLP